jgi:phosphoribosylformimino-5-aminoimidazole carboxamide ribotide isomerase
MDARQQPQSDPSGAAPAAAGSRPFEVIPSIDIRGGRCVRLFQGDYDRETVYDDDPLAVARRWASMGAPRLHVVDLDAARTGVPVNGPLIIAIARALPIPVQAGGGIRDEATARRYVRAGLARVVLGTAAVRDPALVEALASSNPEALIVAVDARDGRVRTEGWTEDSGVTMTDLVARMTALGVRRFLYTDIAVDGTLTEPNYAAYRALAATTAAAVLASGGVAQVAQLPRLAACGVEGAIIGRALYTGAIDLAEALRSVEPAGRQRPE